jgi:hypothetical protein
MTDGRYEGAGRPARAPNEEVEGRFDQTPLERVIEYFDWCHEVDMRSPLVRFLAGMEDRPEDEHSTAICHIDDRERGEGIVDEVPDTRGGWRPAEPDDDDANGHLETEECEGL